MPAQDRILDGSFVDLVLNHVLELLERTNLNGCRSWLWICPFHFTRLRVANLALWKSLLLNADDLAQIWNDERANALLTNGIRNLNLEGLENFRNLLLGKTSRFSDVREDLDLG